MSDKKTPSVNLCEIALDLERLGRGIGEFARYQLAVGRRLADGPFLGLPRDFPSGRVSDAINDARDYAWANEVGDYGLVSKAHHAIVDGSVEVMRFPYRAPINIWDFSS